MNAVAAKLLELKAPATIEVNRGSRAWSTGSSARLGTGPSTLPRSATHLALTIAAALNWGRPSAVASSSVPSFMTSASYRSRIVS